MGMAWGSSLSLRWRLAIALVLLVTPLLLLLTAMQWLHLRQERARLQAESGREAALLANEMGQLVDGVEHLLQSIAISPWARGNGAVHCDAYLKQLEMASHGPAALGISDASGRVICLSRRVSEQQLSTADRYYFRETMRRNEFVTGQFALGKASGAKAIHFGFPARDEHGAATGVVFAPLNLEWLSQRLAYRQMPAFATAVIADRNGTVLARFPDQRLAGQPLPAAWSRYASASAPGTARLIEGRGEPATLLGFVPLGQPPQDLFVAVAFDEAQALEPAWHAVERTAFLAALAVLASVALVWLALRRQLLQPLEEAIGQGEALARGEPPTPSREPGGEAPEFARLHHALHATQEAIVAARSDRGTVEAGLRAARDRAQDSHRTLSDVIAVAAHDLRQPIQSIVFSAALLEQRLSGQSEHPAAQRLERAARQLVSMLDSLMSLSQLEAGRVTPELQRVAVHELVRALAEEFQPQAKAAGLSLHCVTEPAWTHTDPHLLRRLVSNCVSNALKYTPAKGTVTLRCGVSGERGVLRVEDTGIGIAPQHQQQVWEAYRQLGNAERLVERGLGLGLAIVRRTAGLLGLDVSLTSTLGQGTAIEVRLPLAPAPDPAANRLATVLPRPLRGRLLLVEDDPTVAASTAELLQEAGLQVTVSPNAEHALALLERPDHAAFDAVLADHRLPALSGLLVLRSARWPQIPVVLMAGSLPAARAEECAAEGIPVLAKPFSIGALWDALAPLADLRSR